jgi:hypothetical protein
MRRISATLLLGLACLFAAACSPAITYPPEKGVLTSRASPGEPVPTLMAYAIEYAHDQWGWEEDFAINLPAGTPAWVYEKVIKRIGGGHPLEHPGEPAYHVTRVSSQGNTGMVDLFYPKPDGDYGYATLTFELQLIGGYEHSATRIWQTREQPPAPNYPDAVAGASSET